MGWQMSATLANMFMLIQVTAVAIVAVKWIGLILRFVLIISCWYITRATSANTETQRLFSTTNSPILSYIGESISDTSTVRAFNRQ
jgi:ABC-type Mn2+/Zn2+ transport system permease subunit